jgi:hypothetical protein
MIWLMFHIFVITRPLLSICKEAALKKIKSRKKVIYGGDRAEWH